MDHPRPINPGILQALFKGGDDEGECEGGWSERIILLADSPTETSDRDLIDSERCGVGDSLTDDRWIDHGLGRFEVSESRDEALKTCSAGSTSSSRDDLDHFVDSFE